MIAPTILTTGPAESIAAVLRRVASRGREAGSYGLDGVDPCCVLRMVRPEWEEHGNELLGRTSSYHAAWTGGLHASVDWAKESTQLVLRLAAPWNVPTSWPAL